MTRSAKGTALAPGRGVTAKAGLNRGILDNTPHERRRQLAYKAPRFGSELRVVLRTAPRRHVRYAACVQAIALAAGGCSPAPPAATRRTPTTTPRP